MGCVQSKKDINDLHPNTFQVMNVDQLGNQISPGQLEITETDLILYQRKKTPVKWPLRRLRRYGYEGELFSFESGRRCPTGPGIYAFHCLRADRLFNLVQMHIQVDHTVEDEGGAEALGPIIRINTGPSNEAGNYLEPTPAGRAHIPNIRRSSQNGMNVRRLGSVGSSNGPTSPQGLPSPPPISVALLPPAPPPPVPIPATEVLDEAAAIAAQTAYEFNNNNSIPTSQKTYINTSTSTESLDNAAKSNEDDEEVDDEKEDNAIKPTPEYLNVNIGTFSKLIPSAAAIPPKPSSVRRLSGEEPNYARLEIGNETHLCHLYMNVGPQSKSTVVPRVDWLTDETRRCYANLESSEIDVARGHLPKRLSGGDKFPLLPISCPISPTGVTRTVNYIVLDLDQTKKDTNISAASPTSPVSTVSTATLTPPLDTQASKASEGYATIDFNKTVALSHSVNPNAENDTEGSRKTRHNSTINDLTLALD